MIRIVFRELTAEARECCAALARETVACLMHLESLSVVEMERFTAERRHLVALLRDLDGRISRMAEQLEPDADPGWRKELAEYRECAAAALRHVIECDGLLIALGANTLDRQRTELTALAASRQALGKYAGARRHRSGLLNRSA